MSGTDAGEKWDLNYVALTDVCLVLGDHSHYLVTKGLTHELLRDLTTAKTVKPIGHVDCGTLADIEYVVEELLQLGVDDGSVNRQNTGSNLGRKRLASAGKAVTIGRSFEE